MGLHTESHVPSWLGPPACLPCVSLGSCYGGLFGWAGIASLGRFQTFWSLLYSIAFGAVGACALVQGAAW